MAEKIIKSTEEILNPVVLRVPNTGEEFTLDFNRESVKFAEERGFSLDDVSDKPVTGVQNLFWFSFRKNHKRVSLEQSNRLIDELHGLPVNVIKHLMKLYAQAGFSNLINDEEDSKNPEGTWEF